jgi:hypothetical protein
MACGCVIHLISEAKESVGGAARGPAAQRYYGITESDQEDNQQSCETLSSRPGRVTCGELKGEKTK